MKKILQGQGRIYFMERKYIIDVVQSILWKEIIFQDQERNILNIIGEEYIFYEKKICYGSSIIYIMEDYFPGSKKEYFQCNRSSKILLLFMGKYSNYIPSLVWKDNNLWK